MAGELIGVFVGGSSSRMGTPKGRLRTREGISVIEHLTREATSAGLLPVLVGDALPYADIAPGIDRVPDDPPGVGPLGGLRALLLHAIREASPPAVIAVACDMPHVSAPVLGRLLRHEPGAAVVAARRDGGPWEPLLARYRPVDVLPALDAILAGGQRSFQALLARLEVAALPMDAAIERALSDWDRPDDVEG